MNRWFVNGSVCNRLLYLSPYSQLRRSRFAATPGEPSGQGHGPNHAQEAESNEPITLPPGGLYTKVFDQLDLWGDEATPHPGGSYRVTFIYWNPSFLTHLRPHLVL